jgi:hypothetical protein
MIKMFTSVGIKVTRSQIYGGIKLKYLQWSAFQRTLTVKLIKFWEIFLLLMIF